MQALSPQKRLEVIALKRELGLIPLDDYLFVLPPEYVIKFDIDCSIAAERAAFSAECPSVSSLDSHINGEYEQLKLF